MRPFSGVISVITYGKRNSLIDKDHENLPKVLNFAICAAWTFWKNRRARGASPFTRLIGYARLTAINRRTALRVALRLTTRKA
jgi:hypothetical protein